MTDEPAYLANLDRLWARAWPPHVPNQPVYPLGEITLGDYLSGWAARQPDKPALIFYGAVMTYRELDELSDRFAALLAAHGVRPGDPVCVFMQNCPQYHLRCSIWVWVQH